MKTARRSFSKENYNCLKPWPEDCFCQCGGNGVVFTEGSMQETLDNPQEQKEAIKAVLGKDTNKKHYRTAFFEAFPKNPSCFIRGEGATVEEAEEKAFLKWEKIQNCKDHAFDRRGRTDGYCYCTKCPLSGTFLLPTTVCVVCNTPSSRYIDKNKIQYCLHHYYELPPEQIIGDEDRLLGYSKEEQLQHYIEDSKLFRTIKHFNPNLNEEQWNKAWDLYIHVRSQLVADANPLFGPSTKTPAEIHEIMMQDLVALAFHIRQKLGLN